MAMVLLLLLRALQSAAVGGEIPAAMIFAYEISRPQNRALNTNIVMAGTNIGLFLASLACSYLIDNCQHSIIAPWRMAFIIGGVFGILSYFLRRSLHETPEFKKIIHLRASSIPIKHIFQQNSTQIWHMMAFTAFIAALIASFTIIMPNYLTTYKNITQAQTLHLTSYSLFIFTGCAFIAGKFEYLFGKYFLIISIIIFDGVIIWLFGTFDYTNFALFQKIYFILLGYIGIVCGRLPVIVSSFFPTKVRYNGVALSYNIPFGVIAGLSPMLIFTLIKSSNYLWLPALYIVLFSIPALWFLTQIKSRQLHSYY